MNPLFKPKASKLIIGSVISLGLIIFSSIAWTVSQEFFFPKPNLVLISVDTLRSDYFSPEYMPLTYQWAQNNAIIFTDAYSPANWTKPSHASMFTGLLPRNHGMELRESTVPDDLQMVQHELKKKGYHTYATVNGGPISKGFGFDKGFDRFDEFPLYGADNYTVQCLKPLDTALDVLPTLPRPFYAWIHTFYVHEWNINHRTYSNAAGYVDWIEQKRIAKDAMLKDLSSEDAHNLYAEQVRAFDPIFAGFLKRLSESIDDLYIIILSDHGEGLMDKFKDEYMSLGHGGIPIPTQSHVPFVLFGSGVGINHDLVSTIEVHKLLLSLTNRKVPDLSLTTTTCESYVRKKRLIATISKNSYRIEKIPSISVGERIEPELSSDLKKQLRALGYLK